MEPTPRDFLIEDIRLPRPRKLLALDGGGIRGVLTLEILLRLERLLAERTGRGAKFRLCHFFDYMAGTSTGAIVAAGLAQGKSVPDLLKFYLDMGPAMFKRASVLHRLRRFFESRPLADQLKAVFGEHARLTPGHLECLLLVVARNATTDSPWPISSNPLAKYNAPDRADCNLQIPLWQLVRASTAAPIYFPPETLQWDPRDPTKTFVFVDGGVTPYNNPAFLLYRMATLEPYRLQWNTGERQMLLVSVGTGSAPKINKNVARPDTDLLTNLRGLPGALMYAAQKDQDINCRTVGRCAYGAEIDREIGDLIPRKNGQPVPLGTDLGRAFLYSRYDAELSRQGLASLGLPKIDPARVEPLDAVRAIPELRQIGQAASKAVDLRHFGIFADSFRVIALAGRRVDASDAAERRFRAQDAAAVRARIRSVLKHRARVLVCSAAAGADLIVLDEAGELGVPRHVILPYAADRFRATSVTDRPGKWGPMFDRVIAEARTVGTLSVLAYDENDRGAFEAVNRSILEQAQLLARSLATLVLPVVVWDGERRGERDWTASFLERASQLAEPLVIPTHPV